MAKRTILRANEGMVLTNGKIYGTLVYLADDVEAMDFYQITRDEYNLILESKNDI